MTIILTDDDEQTRGFRVGKWRKHTNYKCIYCQYATLWKDKILKHIAEGVHPWPYPGTSEPSDDVDLNADPEY
jgi:hypothetical protein